jgi:hypothetical protein
VAVGRGLGGLGRGARGLRLPLLRRAIDRGAALSLGSAAGAPLGAGLSGH